MNNNLGIKIGIRHFKSEAKIIRSEPITFIAGLKDIIDNVLGLSKENNKKYEQRIQFKVDTDGNVYQIIISDSVEHGFKDIDKNGEKNPLNMGHIRAEHSIDNTTSEFGVGMKKTFIFTSHKTTVYTKCVNENGTNYYKIEFDFRDMCSREEAINSYEPVLFETITQEQFLNKKPDDIGSIIILEELIPSSLGNLTLKEDEDKISFLNSIKKELGVTYRDVINKHIDIYVNDDKVEPSRDMKKIDGMQTFDLFVQLDDKKEPKNMYYHNLKTNTWFIFDKNEKDFSRIAVDNLIKTTKDFPIKIFYCDDYNNGEGDSNLNAMTEMVRDGRSFGKIKITKTEKDGYSNYIYSRVEWTSKTLNSLFGVSSSKTITKKEGDLMLALERILKKPEKESRKKRKIESKKKKEEEKNKSDEEDEDDDDIQTEIQIYEDEDILPPKVNKKVNIQPSNIIVEDEEINIIIKDKNETDIVVSNEEQNIIIEDEEENIIIEDEEQNTVVNEESNTVVNEKTNTVVNEESNSVVNEESNSVVNEESNTVVNEESNTVVNEESNSVVNEESNSVVNEESKSVVNEESNTVVNEEQNIVVNEESNTIVNEEQNIVVNEETINDPRIELINTNIGCANTDKLKKIIEIMSREFSYEKLKEILTQAQ